ncbi:MAG: IS91 family transposase [Planctomycetota bacterium]|jgi:predicted Zn-ribbon and HTH transcriptional regulator
MEKTHNGQPSQNNKEKPEVADIFRVYGQKYRQSHSISYEHMKTMHHIKVCRSAELGGHMEQCSECGFERNAYNSCRDRHCPKCQTLVKEQWLNDRKAELLPCGYFHLVFTLPHELNPIILCNKRVTLKILFTAVNETLKAFAKDPKWHLYGRHGFIAVLHTWSQTLMDHFHLHCLVPAGVLSFKKDRWIPAHESFLFRTESLAKEFKKRYLNYLTTAYRKGELIFPGDTAQFESQQGFAKLLASLSEASWIAYAKRPFAGPFQVLEYLGRYTHRVAISNNRILSILNGKITFTYRDRQRNNEIRKRTLAADEFIRRFLLHILPGGFMKIRYFGFLAHTNKKQAVALIRKLIDPNITFPDKIKESILEMMLRLTGKDITCCPKCRKGTMRKIRKLPRLYCNSS